MAGGGSFVPTIGSQEVSGCALTQTKVPGLHRRLASFPLPRRKRMIDFNNAAFFKLKESNEYASRVTPLLSPGEKVLAAYKGFRDGVVFTDKRIISVNVQGITGRKIDYTSLPYSKIVAYSVETAGSFDLDSELEMYFSGLGKVKLEFSGKTNIVQISNLISSYVLN
jgi:hypothetical protein